MPLSTSEDVEQDDRDVTLGIYPGIEVELYKKTAHMKDTYTF